MRTVLETCVPRQSILQGTFNPEIFTAALGPVIQYYKGQTGTIDAIYTDAFAFFRDATYPTEGLRQTVSNVFRRIAGDPSVPSIQRMETAFGGGKTHNLIACVHIAYRGKEIADVTGDIREYLKVRDGGMRVGIYAGGRAVWYNPTLGRDENVTHEEIKRLFLAGEIDLLLCTDAAAEGLNLQTADLLINFDLGWNPMKIEQRIGRIDRIGQKYNDIEVLNMCYLGSTEEVVYGRLLERLQQADLIVGAQQISMLPVEPREFRDLQNGTLTLEELTKESIKRLKKQKEATASMEMSAEDMYQMYNRMSSEMRSQHFPANLDDLWTALIASPYFQNKGAHVDDDGIWHLPETGRHSELAGTIDRNVISEKTEFLTWGSTTLDNLFEEIIGDRISEMQCIRKVSVSEDHAELVGYNTFFCLTEFIIDQFCPIQYVGIFDRLAHRPVIVIVNGIIPIWPKPAIWTVTFRFL